MTNRRTYKTGKILGFLILWTAIMLAALFTIGLYLQWENKQVVSKVNYFAIESPGFLWLLLGLIPLFIGIYFIIYWKNKKLALLSESSFRNHVVPTISNWSLFLKLFFFINFYVFGILTIANPLYGKKSSKINTKALQIMVALDISNSMLCEDISGGYSRLEIAKKAIEELLNNLEGDQVGFVIFAGDAYLQMPLTTDYEGAKVFLEPIEPNMISNQGTNISAALKIANESFSGKKNNRTILLISDGEAHQKGALDMAQFIKEDGVVINTVGMGSEKGGMVPHVVNGKFEGYKKEQNGEFVISKVNQSMMQNLAVSGGGVSILSDKVSLDFTSLFNRLKTMTKAKVTSNEMQIGTSRYLIFNVLAAISLTGFIVVSILNPIKR